MAIGEDQISLLRQLVRCKSACSRRALIKAGGKRLQRALREIALNVLRGAGRLNKKQLKRLSKHKEDVRALARKNTSGKRREKIIQKGDFLGSLLIPILGTLTSTVLSKV